MKWFGGDDYSCWDMSTTVCGSRMKFGRGRMKFAMFSAVFLVMFQAGTGMVIRDGGSSSLGTLFETALTRL